MTRHSLDEYRVKLHEITDLAMDVAVNRKPPHEVLIATLEGVRVLSIPAIKHLTDLDEHLPANLKREAASFEERRVLMHFFHQRPLEFLDATGRLNLDDILNGVKDYRKKITKLLAGEGSESPEADPVTAIEELRLQVTLTIFMLDEFRVHKLYRQTIAAYGDLPH
jgi:hypothetical protein